MHDNPLIDSLYQIYKAEVIKELVDDYHFIKQIYPDDIFQSLMDDLKEEILALQSEIKKKKGDHIHPIAIAMLICTETTTDEETGVVDWEAEEKTNKHLKACAVWMTIEKNYK